RARLFVRGFYGLCDLLVCAPLALLLHRRGRPLALVVAWAWNPWMALEFAGGGHLDALAILCTVSALACLAREQQTPPRRGALGAALLVLGAGVTFLPGGIVPFALRIARRRGLVLGAVLASAALALWPFVLLTGGLPRSDSGLSDYAFRWEAFNLLHRGVEAFFARFHAYDESMRDP